MRTKTSFLLIWCLLMLPVVGLAADQSLILPEREMLAAETKDKPMTLSVKRDTLHVGEKITIKVNNAGQQNVSWASSNEKIAIVSAKGVVKGISEGTVTITAKVGKTTLKVKLTIQKSLAAQLKELKKEIESLKKTVTKQKNEVTLLKKSNDKKQKQINALNNSAQFYYSNFEKGGLSRKTGKALSDESAVRSIDYIPINQLVSARISANFYIRCYLYDESFNFLAASDRLNEITQIYVKKLTPGGKYCKIVAYNPQKTGFNSNNLTQYELEVYIKQRNIQIPHYKESISLSDFTNDMANGYLSGHIVKIIEGTTSYKQIFSCIAKYESENGAYPVIQFKIVDHLMQVLYYSPSYRLGNAAQYEEMAWRIPPYQDRYNKLRVEITVPDGVKLSIQKIGNAIDLKEVAQDDGVLFHAHQGFSGYCPASTTKAFRMAGEMGYKSCITIPKFTSDGICVCFHDDSTIRNLLRYSDGSVIPQGSADDRPVSEFTYEDLCSFDAGVRKSKIFALQRVPTLDEFFEICSLYQMSPVLSVHWSPEFIGEEGVKRFTCIRELAKKHGVLGKLSIKSSGSDVLQAALAVFGHDIDGYIILEPINEFRNPIVFARQSGFISQNEDNLARCDYKLTLEFFRSRVLKNEVKKALENGFIVSVATVSPGIDGPELERLIDMGVTEFTIDHHCSMGLNW